MDTTGRIWKEQGGLGGMSEVLTIQDIEREYPMLKRSYIYDRLLRPGRLPSFVLGRRRVVLRDDLIRFITEERERQLAEVAG